MKLIPRYRLILSAIHDVDLAKDLLITFFRRQGGHMSGDCTLDLARKWSDGMIDSDLL